MIDADEIREIIRLTGLKQGALADAVGVSQPTVSRWLRPVDPQVPDPAAEKALRDLRAKAEYEGKRLDPEASPFRLRATTKVARPKSIPTTGLIPAQDSLTLTRVDRLVGAGIFRRMELFDDDLGELISAPRDPDFPQARQIAYRVDGDSMNNADPKPIHDGDFIICALWEDLGMDEAEGDGLNVVVEQTIDDGRLRERSVKEMRVFDDRTEFLPRSTNQLHDPIVVRKVADADDGRQVRIQALVRFVFDNQPLGRARLKR